MVRAASRRVPEPRIADDDTTFTGKVEVSRFRLNKVDKDIVVGADLWAQSAV